jgi:hypothetical protein
MVGANGLWFYPFARRVQGRQAISRYQTVYALSVEGVFLVWLGGTEIPIQQHGGFSTYTARFRT